MEVRLLKGSVKVCRACVSSGSKWVLCGLLLKDRVAYVCFGFWIRASTTSIVWRGRLQNIFTRGL